MDELDDTGAEVKQVKEQIVAIEKQLRFLKTHSEFSAAHVKLLSFQVMEEVKRIQASIELHSMLKHFTQQQKDYIKELEWLIMQSPLHSYHHTLSTPIDSYIHLSANVTERREKMLQVRDENAEMIRNHINYQARVINPMKDFCHVDSFEKFGKIYCVVFNIKRFEHCNIAQITQAIRQHYLQPNESDYLAKSMGDTANVQSFDYIPEAMIHHARFVAKIAYDSSDSSNQDDVDDSVDNGYIVQEGQLLLCGKHVDGELVFMIDYVDKDELHPYNTRNRVRKDVSHGMVISPCNIEPTTIVVKHIGFSKHHFHAFYIGSGLSAATREYKKSKAMKHLLKPREFCEFMEGLKEVVANSIYQKN